MVGRSDCHCQVVFEGKIFQQTHTENFYRFSAEIGSLLNVLSYVVIQQGNEIRNQGFMSFLKQQVSEKIPDSTSEKSVNFF